MWEKKPNNSDKRENIYSTFRVSHEIFICVYMIIRVYLIQNNSVRVFPDSSIFIVKGGLFKFSSQKWKIAKLQKQQVQYAKKNAILSPNSDQYEHLGLFLPGEEFQQATHGKFWKGVWFVGKICEISSLPPTGEAVQSLFTFRSVLVTGSTEAQLTYSPAVCTASFYLSVSTLSLCN